MALFSYSQLLQKFHPLRRLDKARVAALKNEKLPDFVKRNLIEPYPGIEDEARELEYICLDIETTGLDPDNDQILSIGWVMIKDMHVHISGCAELMIKTTQKVAPEAAVINHITPEMLSTGVSLDEALSEFFIHAQGKVIVVHGAVVEQNFFNAYLNQKFGLPELPFLWLDTLTIEKYLSMNIGREIDYDLRLSSIRKNYGLPEYHSHGALIDALSTAELFLAQFDRVYRDGKTCFGRLYRISRG